MLFEVNIYGAIYVCQNLIIFYLHLLYLRGNQNFIIVLLVKGNTLSVVLLNESNDVTIIYKI